MLIGYWAMHRWQCTGKCGVGLQWNACRPSSAATEHISGARRCAGVLRACCMRGLLPHLRAARVQWVVANEESTPMLATDRKSVV